MADFIANKGKIVRVFFLTGWDQLKEAEVQKILTDQDKFGVEVYVTNANEMPSHLKKLFLVESKGRIAWEVSVGPSHEITQVSATSDPRVTQRFNRDFKEILEVGATRRFVPDGHDSAGALNAA